MNLLTGKLYDPAVAVTLATTSATAMTAMDTTNLRLTGTVPASGMIYWKISGGALHGATTFPQILVGVMSGASVLARKAPEVDVTNLAATSLASVRAEGLITGLTPGAAFTYDAAFCVETVVAATGWKYGGPNTNTANNAFGGVSFELWDPQPIYTSVPATVLSGRIPAALVGGRMDASVGAMAADVVTSSALAASAVTEIQTGLATAAALDTVDNLLDTEVAAIKAVTDKLDTALEMDVSVWRFTVNALEQGPAGGGAGGLDAAGVRAALGMASANLDTQLSGISAKTDNLPASPATTAAVDTVHTCVTAMKATMDARANSWRCSR
jgi:hypothetical protein